MKRLSILSGLAMAACASAACAQAPAATPASACGSEPHRQFDFWLGEWSVHGGPSGDQLQGRNTIERSANGCWLTEHWRSAKGSDGVSLNAWDAQHGVWRQFWVGADGVVLRLEGGLQDGAMVMAGELPGTGGTIQKQKISWTPHTDGRVTQHWQISDDGGETWQTSFLGVYRREPVTGE